jgi:transcriptional regulator with XRE-family HTH domain
MKLKVGTKLKELREDRKLTIEQMAGLLSIHPSSYSRLERNETSADFVTLVRYAETLGVPIHDFLPELTAFNNNNHHTHAGASIIFGNLIYHASSDETLYHLEQELTLVKEKLAHWEEKVRLLESQVQLLQNLLERVNLHS